MHNRGTAGSNQHLEMALVNFPRNHHHPLHEKPFPPFHMFLRLIDNINIRCCLFFGGRGSILTLFYTHKYRDIYIYIYIFRYTHTHIIGSTDRKIGLTDDHYEKIGAISRGLSLSDKLISTRLSSIEWDEGGGGGEKEKSEY